MTLNTVREEAGDPVTGADALRGKSVRRRVRGAAMSTSAKSPYSKLSPWIPMGKEAVNTIFLPLLYHRAEALIPQAAFSNGLV